MTDFLILTDPHGNKRLVAINKIVHIDYATGGGSLLYLVDDKYIQARESVETISENMSNFYN